jgi:hypothetical protein
MTLFIKLPRRDLAVSWTFQFLISARLLILLNSCAATKQDNQPAKSLAIPVASSDSFADIVRTLPPRFLSNCPYADRETMLEELQGSTNEGRLDSAKGWLHYFSDGGYVNSDSMIRLKSFKNIEGQQLAFVHMMKPKNGVIPSPDHTRILKIRESEWMDITSDVIPAWIDLTWHFNPRKQNLIEVGPWEDGRHPKLCLVELRWNGSAFEARKVKPRPFWDEVRSEPYGQQ